MSTDGELLDRLRLSLEPAPLAPPAPSVAALRAAVAHSAALVGGGVGSDGAAGSDATATTGLPAASQVPVQPVSQVPVPPATRGPVLPSPARRAEAPAHLAAAPPARRRRAISRWRAPALAAAVVFAFAGGRLLGTDEPAPPGGVVEFAGPLRAPDGSVGGRATVERFGIGRVITFDSERLPILPAGELYEVWFVGPGDAPGAPDRISAGTFHPDPEGRSSVRLVAAVDPAAYPAFVVTAEPAGGDPAPNGPEVLRATIADPP